MKKVLISDEVSERIISMVQFDATGLERDVCEYPYAMILGERFYYNRFVFL